MISIAMKPKISDAMPGAAEIDRSDLRIADAAEPVREERRPLPRRTQLPRCSGTPA